MPARPCEAAWQAENMIDHKCLAHAVIDNPSASFRSASEHPPAKRLPEEADAKTKR
jgi:hypothetical protein